MLELPDRGWLHLGGIEIAPAKTSDFRLTLTQVPFPQILKFKVTRYPNMMGVWTRIHTIRRTLVSLLRWHTLGVASVQANSSAGQRGGW